MSRREPIRVATRGSDLALRQAATVRRALADRHFEVELVEVETTGDRVRDELIQDLGKTGAFVRSLDERVLAGDVDLAVHSLKDVPTEQPEELVVAAVPERGPAGDVLVTPDGRDLDELPREGVVGTASLRRSAQVRAARPDLTVEPIRGNVDTRIEKLLAPSLQAEHTRRLEAEENGDGNGSGSEEGEEDEPFDRSIDDWFDDLAEIERSALEREVEEEFDALVLAEAGLDRIGLLRQVGHRRLPTGEFVPAPGQGALAVTARDGELAEQVHEVLDHPRSRVEVTAERIVLAEVGGGCIAPIGVHAVVKGEHVHIDAQAFHPESGAGVSLSRDLPIDDYAAGARRLAADLRDRGADEFVAIAREEADETPRGDGP